jgi:hypothetical protein
VAEILISKYDCKVLFITGLMIKYNTVPNSVYKQLLVAGLRAFERLVILHYLDQKALLTRHWPFAKTLAVI